jgi:hypothetical protein
VQQVEQDAAVAAGGVADCAVAVAEQQQRWTEFRYVNHIFKPNLVWDQNSCNIFLVLCSLKVAELKTRLEVEPSFALVHPHPGPGVIIQTWSFCFTTLELHIQILFVSAY